MRIYTKISSILAVAGLIVGLLPKLALAAPAITGIQGYNPSGNPQYTENQALAGTFVVLYGSFAATGNQLVSTGTVSGTISGQTTNQINVQLPPSTTGTATFAISNSTGTSPAKSIAVVSSIATTGSTLTISNDTTLVTGPIPTGTVNYTFAAFKLAAGNNPVTVTSFRIVSDSASRNEFRNIVLYKDRSEFIGNNVSQLTSNGSASSGTFTFTPALTIPANTTVLVDVSASITTNASGTVRLGIEGFQFSGTAPTITPSLPVYGNNIQVGGGGQITDSATLSATTTAASCTATTAPVSVSVQGTGGVTYIVQRNGSNYVTFVGGGSVTDSIAIGATSSYTLYSSGQQIGTSKSVTGARQSGCTTTGSVSATISRDLGLPQELSVSAGQKNVNWFDAKITASGGDVYVYSLAVGGATATDLDKLENERMTIDGTTVLGVGGGSNSVGSSAAGYTLPQAVLITNGSSKVFRFIADITGSASGTSSPKITGYSIKAVSGQDATVTVSGTVGTVLTITNNGGQNGALTITTPETLPEGTVGQKYSYTFTASGGTAPYTWSALPGQYSIYPCCYAELSTSGVFSSTGTGNYMPFSGTYQLPVKVTDKNGVATQKIVQYTVKLASPGAGKIAEGYIDTLSATTVSGWAFTNQPTGGQVPTITIQFENVNNTSQVFTLTTQPNQVRGDVAGYIQNKYSISTTLATGFSASPSSVITTSGTYRIKVAQFDGNTFTLSESAKRSFTIGAGTNNPVGKYVKVEGDPTVYWITSWGGKMPILSAAVFTSYGGRFEDVIIISQEVLDDYEDVLYIKLQGNARVYKIEGGVKRYLTPAAATRLSVDPGKVVTVNATEFYSYRTGQTIN